MFELAVNWNEAIEKAVTGTHLLAPELILVAVGCFALLVDLVTPREKSGERLAWIAVLGTFAAGWLAARAFAAPPSADQSVFWGAVSIDRFACFFKGVILLGTIFSIVLVHESRELQGRAMGEFYGLLFMAVAGMCFMVGASDLVTAFLSIELVSVPSFALVAYLRRDRLGTEASIKYVLYSAFSTGLLLFGLSILFGLTGSTSFSNLTHVLNTQDSLATLTAAVACLLAFAGFAFKMAAAPFHFWAPDVYQGAPTPVTAWLSVTSKAAGVGLFMRFFLSFIRFDVVPLPDQGVLREGTFALGSFDWVNALIIISCLTMTIGNLGAMWQTSMKRLLAYSSVAHVGYILMGVAATQVTVSALPHGDLLQFALPSAADGVTPEPNGGAAAAFYIAAYLFMNLGAFACVIAVSNCTGNDDLQSFRALGRRAPVIALAMAMFIFGLIGLPPTAGFSGKLQLFMAAIEQAKHRPAFWWLVGVASVNSVVAVYYYLKVAKTMFLDGMSDPDAREPLPTSWALTLVAALLVLPVIGLGLFFQRILDVTLTLDLLRSAGM
jgi:NADH-quinone oxidoreductase subunit N